MDRSVLMAVVIALGVALLVLMVVGWRARQRRQSTIASPLAPPVEIGEVFGVFAGRYVATTVADDPLDRIAVNGLGFRSLASLSVTTDGVLVERPGERRWWIPASRISEVRRATWTIDRVVESDGLHLIAWSLGETQVDSYFRLDAPGPFDSAFARLLETEGRTA
jgi:hypothetical protein